MPSNDLAIAYGIHQRNKKKGLSSSRVEPKSGMDPEDAKSLVESILAKRAPKTDETLETDLDADLLLGDEDLDPVPADPVTDRKAMLNQILAKIGK